MTFDDILDQVIALLKRQGRVSYRALKRRFDIDDDYIEDLKEELLYVHPVIDDEAKGLIWTGEPESASASTSAPPSAVAEPKPPPISYTPAYLTEKILTSRSALEGERKQVTVLFADIKDSTELIKDLDPEAAQQLLDPAIHIMMEAVHRYEGTVNQVLGDGIMSIFGAPIAHEDHAARACYAALAMQAAMQPYADEMFRSHGITMQIRVGLNSGEVVVRTIGNDLHMDYSAVGQTTHLASRMEQLATPGSITLTGATLRLVEGLVRVHARGAVPVKGMTEPVEVYELIGASTIRRRLQAAVARGLTKFVGRDTEIDALNQALEQASSGHGQVVAAVGEAGVGKSRLVYEFIHSHRTQGWLVLESASVSYGKATPYFPVIDLLKRYAHIEEGDESRSIRAKITGQILTLDESLQETIPALLSLLDALAEDSPFLQLDPPQRRRRTLDGLKRILLRESQVQPLLLVFEDLHWIDSETQALLDSLVESLPTAQLLLLVNYRPEYQHGWGSKTFYTQLRLDPLQAESAGAFLQALLGDDPSLEPLKKLLIERTEGNPFFLEESVRTLVETQVLVGEPGAYRLAQESPAIHVPATVQAILAARIDRLPADEKRLLQSAAVIGAEVSVPLLQVIAELSEDVLQRGLTHLQAAEFLYETGLFPERVYTFKHALTHDVAYGSLLQERRRHLHGRIVETLESGMQREEQVERLAYHAVRGAVWDKAVTYCQKVGIRAHDHSAYREAVVSFEQALNALAQLPETRDTIPQGIDLRLLLDNTFTHLRELTQAADLLRQAEELAESLGDQQRLARIASRMSRHDIMFGNYARAIASGERALALVGTDIGTGLGANFNIGVAYHLLGDYARAREVFTRNVIAIPGDQVYERFGLPYFPALGCRAWLARCLCELGDFAQARVYVEESARIATVIDLPFELSAADCWVGFYALRQGDISRAIAVLERGLARCRKLHMPFWISLTSGFLGAAYTLDGRPADAVPLLQQARIGRVTISHTLNLVHLSEALLLTGRRDEAVQVADEALDRILTYGQRGNQAWVMRLQGDIARYGAPLDGAEAETHYQQALTLSTELGMRPLQAHCHRALGTLYSQIGRTEQARAELATAIEMYRDMEMTFWLPQATEALAQMQERP